MKLSNLKSILLGICLLCLSGFAQQKNYELPSSQPQAVGLRTYHLSYIDSLAQQALTEQQVPGLVALVVRDGKIAYHKAFGQADPSGKKLETSSIFRIASQTKAITSTAAMILWERGKFQLDDPISKYIPEFKDAQVLDSVLPDGSYTSHKADKPISIRHLLTHTSGIGYGAIDGDPRFRKLFAEAGIIDGFTTKNITLAENEPKVARLPLHHNPGERFTYSEGIDVVGYLVELLSGKKLDVFMREEIFEPLAMTDTYFYLPKEKHERLVAVQTLENGTWTESEANSFYEPNYPTTGAQTFFSGGAGLSSTALDYAQFLQMYINGGELNGKRILSPTTVDVILSNHIGDIWADQGAGHGLAFKVIGEGASAKGGQGSPGTFEWGGYFNTQYFADPQQKLIGIIMKQTLNVPNDQTAWKFRNIVFSSIEK